jgi:phage shock protein A
VQQERDSALFKVQTLKYMISGGGKTWTQMADDLANIPGGGGADPEMEQLRRDFEQNMLLFGAADEEFDSARNYQLLPNFLVSRIRDLNKQLTDLRLSENKLTAQKDQLEKDAAQRTKQFEDGQKKAHDDLMAELDKYKQERQRIEEAKNNIASMLAEKDTKIADLTTQLQDQEQRTSKQIADMENVIEGQRLRLQETKEDTFEVADARIDSANQAEGMVYINVGSADNLREQQTFSVYDRGTSGLLGATAKGRIEVTRILGERVAECRILEDDLSNIIVPGDIVYTPAWAPGRPIHVAVAGLIDVTGNGKSDMELFKNLIRLNGGVIDEEVTPATSFLVEGEMKSDAPGGEMTAEERNVFVTKVGAAQSIGIDRLSIDKFLAKMGWKGDVRALSLGRGRAGEFQAAPDEEAAAEPDAAGADVFRPRTPPARGDGGAF